MSRSITRRDFVIGAALAPTAVAAAARLARLRAFVTADLESKVVVVDVASGRRLGEVRTPPGPRSIEPVGSLLVVCHSDDGLATLVSPRGRRVVGEITGMSEPRYVAAPAGGIYAYVTDSARGEIAIVDVAERRVVGRIDVGGPARHITIDPTGSVLWAALGTTAERIAIVELADPRRLARVRTIAAPDRAHDVVFTADGRQVWVTSGTERRIVVHDAARRRPVFAVAADAAPQHVAMLGGVVAVASGDDGSARFHDRRGRVVGQARTPIGSFNVATLDGVVVSPSLSTGEVTLVRPGSRPRSRRVGRQAHDACLVRA